MAHFQEPHARPPIDSSSSSESDEDKQGEGGANGGQSSSSSTETSDDEIEGPRQRKSVKSQLRAMYSALEPYNVSICMIIDDHISLF